MISEHLRDLAAMSLFSHVHAETEMTSLTLESEWQVSVETGTATFTNSSGTTHYPIQFVGSIEHAAGTWTWGWSESLEEPLPAKALTLTTLVHDRGVSLGIPELSTPVVTLSETPSLLLRLAVETIGGRFHTLTVDAGRGVSRLFVVEIGPLHPLSGTQLVDVTMQGADLGVTDNHLDALECYARQVGLDYSVTSHDPLTATIGAGDFGIEIQSDESGRLVGLRAQPQQVQWQAS